MAGRIARPADDGMITISLDEPGGATIVPKHEPAPARPTAPAPVAATTEPSIAVDPTLPTAADAGTGAGAMIGGCALAHDLGVAIARDPLAMAELDSLPVGVRSSADAVMLWNGQWLDIALPPGLAGGATRRVTEQVVSAAASDCREAQISGPQFVPVPEAGRTVMIVIGSGNWRWAELLPVEPQ